jgi:protein-L-isoaspartate(D-aspartate) O-methyltransferase
MGSLASSPSTRRSSRRNRRGAFRPSYCSCQSTVIEKVASAVAASALSAGCDTGTPTVVSDAVVLGVADPKAVDSPRARALRERLVASLVAGGDVKDNRVANAMRRVPRHAFVPDAPLEEAYANFPLPIGFDQTISQPMVVAIMTEALWLAGRESVLEVGTGSGYQAAILGVLSREVFTIEIVAELAHRSSRRLADLGYTNVHVRAGDGYRGWPERAPFDRILVTAAPPVMPQALLDQLSDGGVLVAPVGPSPSAQTLLRYRKHSGRFEVDDLGAVAFVPMVSLKESPSDASPLAPARR